ncbi:MAG: KpsF/GutQ family sugar-phosphate isomerase [Bacteroidales bacterium]|nr:KpsF/GutQ family sugar-phosphate isomerase [Bacteroidales bacterium]
MKHLTNRQISEIAVSTLISEAEAINGLKEFVDENFANCVRLIYESKGRVVVTGIGKSAIIGQKIVASLNSTGTPSIFMHAADAVHGDLGIVQPDDIIIGISNSGNTPEIKVLLPFIRLSGNKLIAMVGNPSSYLARQADFVIRTSVQKEVGLNNLAPTTSTAAQLAMGDALAVCLLEYRGFTQEKFAMLHPGGTLGKKLFLRVSDIFPNNEKPSVQVDADIPSAIIEISSKRLGATAVLNGDQLVGIITDGDLRRMMQGGRPMNELKASDIMTKNPKTISPGMLVAHALDVMRTNNITQLPVTDNNVYLGVIHIHDILREGIL